MAEKEKNQKKDAKPQAVKVEKTRDPNFTSIYVNTAQVQIGVFDLRISMGIIPEDEKDDDIIRMTERVEILMSPQHAKALARLLSGNIKRYEAEFGEINITPKSPEMRSAIVETE